MVPAVSITHTRQSSLSRPPHTHKAYVRDGVIETPTNAWEALVLPLN